MQNDIANGRLAPPEPRDAALALLEVTATNVLLGDMVADLKEQVEKLKAEMRELRAHGSGDASLN